MGFPSTPYFLCFHYFGPTATHSHFSTAYTTHGLLFLSFRTPLSSFTSSRPICLFHELMIYYSYPLGLMGFLSICQLFSVRVVGFSFPLGLPKWPLTDIKSTLTDHKCSLAPTPPKKPRRKSWVSRDQCKIHGIKNILGLPSIIGMSKTVMFA